MPSTNGDLTPKQQRFVDEYLVDLNATQAYRRAGYSAKSDKVAAANGAALLANHKVSAAVAAAQAKRAAKVEVTQEYVVTRLLQNAERCMQAEPVLDKEGKPIGVYVFQPGPANKALELLGKHIGMFADNLNLRTPDGPLTVEVVRQIIPSTNRIAQHVNGNGKAHSNGNGNGKSRH